MNTRGLSDLLASGAELEMTGPKALVVAGHRVPLRSL
jgi:hypothetical protein